MQQIYSKNQYRSVISIKFDISTWVFSCKFAAYFQSTFSPRAPLEDYFCIDD